MGEKEKTKVKPTFPDCKRFSTMAITRKRLLPGRDSIGREQREIPGLFWQWLGTGSWACWAETNQSKSRERILVLFGLNKHDQDLE